MLADKKFPNWKPQCNTNVTFSSCSPNYRDTTVVLEACYVIGQNATHIQIEHQGEVFYVPRKHIVKPEKFSTTKRATRRTVDITVDQAYARRANPPLI